MIKTLAYVFYTEMLLMLRQSQEWLYSLVFFVVTLCLFPLAFTPDPIFLQKIIPGCVWIAALFSSLLSIQHIFYVDMEEGNLEQWLLSQTPLSLLVLIKMCAHWCLTALPLVLLTPLFCSAFHLPFAISLMLSFTLLIGTPLFTLLGSFVVALTLGLRQQGVMLGLLVFPLIIPVLIFAVIIVQQFVVGLPVLGPIAFLLGLSVFALTLMPLVIAATLRLGLDC